MYVTTKEELKNFCDNIVFLRKQRKLTQKETAKGMGICLATLRSIERGTFPPRVSYKVLFYTSRFFDLSLDDLFNPLTEKKP